MFAILKSRRAKPFSKAQTTLGIVCLVATVLGASLAGCGKKEAVDEEKIPKAASSKTPVAKTPLQVSVVTVVTKTISQSVDVTGTLSTLNDVTVGAKLAGKIAAVYAREGDAVRAGQLVAQMDTADAKAQFDQANANYLSSLSKSEQSRVMLRNAKTNLQLTKDQTASALKQAQAGLNSAKEQFAIVQNGARTQEIQISKDNSEAAKADRDRAKFDLTRAESEQKRTAGDLKRYQDLSKQDAISAQALDQASAAADSAAAAYSSAVEGFNASDSRYRSSLQSLSLIQEGSRKEDIRKAQAAADQAKQMVLTAQSNRDNIKLRELDVQNDIAGINLAEAGARQMRAALALAQQNLNDTRIVSPIEGVVAERKVEPGTQIGAGKDIMRLVALRAIFYDAQVSETQYSLIHPGQTVAVRVDALSGKVFNGNVSKIFPVASPTARSFTVRIAIPNQTGTLRPNLFARGQIVVDTHQNAIVAPHEAILDSDGKKGRVFVINGKKAEARKVTIGISSLGETEITSGVQAGDKLILTGLTQMQDGDDVQVSAPTASNP